MKPVSSPIKRAQKRTLETRKKIFESAITLFQKKGFDNTTVAEITEAADVGKGTFFSHFPTKEAVLADIGTHVLAEMKKVHDRASVKELSAKAEIELLFTAATRWHSKNRELSKLVSTLILLNPSSIEADRENRKWLIDLIIEIIAKGQKSKEFSKTAPSEIVAQSLLGIYFFTLINWHLTGWHGDLVKINRTSQGLILRGISL